MLSSRASGLMLVRGRVEPWLAAPSQKRGGVGEEEGGGVEKWGGR